MTFAALRTVAAGLKGVGAKAIGGRLAAGLKQGAEAGKLGQKIPVMADLVESGGTVTRRIPVAPDLTGASGMVPYDVAKGERIVNATRMGMPLDDALAFADGIETVTLPGVTAGDIGQNLAARFGNALTTPPAQANIMGTVIGVGLGQNPIAALGSNVAGNYVGRAAGNIARQRFGADSIRAGVTENLVNFGVSYKGGEFLSGILGSGGDPAMADQDPRLEGYMRGLAAQDEFARTGTSGGLGGRYASPIGVSRTEQEAQMRQGQAQVLSQRQMPSNGGMRQMADLQGAAGAYQRPLPPEGRLLQMADRPGMVMADIPPLDAATADKLRKRAIENAQGSIFSATQLGSYMEGM
jgi:hypothetical protein